MDHGEIHNTGSYTLAAIRSSVTEGYHSRILFSWLNPIITHISVLEKVDILK